MAMMSPMTAAYGMPQQQMMMPQQMMQQQVMPQYGAMPMMQQQPVYFNSMSQLPPGAIPVSQGMLAQALGQSQVGAQVVQPDGASPLKSMLKGAGVGAAAGAAFGIIPFLPLGIFSGAIVGAGVGAALGLVKGLKAKKAEGEFHTMSQEQQRAQIQAQMAASTPPGARSATAPMVAERTPVVMGPEMRKKWAAKVAAEKAAAARS